MQYGWLAGTPLPAGLPSRAARLPLRQRRRSALPQQAPAAGAGAKQSVCLRDFARTSGQGVTKGADCIHHGAQGTATVARAGRLGVGRTQRSGGQARGPAAAGAAHLLGPTLLPTSHSCSSARISLALPALIMLRG